jgi:hypothetical protein
MSFSKSNEFSEYYKTISNAELLGILENFDNYQPGAIEAAKVEYSNRNLSDIEIQEARNVLNEEKKKKDMKKEKFRIIENKAKSIALDISETIRPSQSSSLSTGKIINVISLVFGTILIFRVIFDVRSIFEYFEKFSLDILWYVEPLIVLSLAVFFFWQRVTIGWILLMFFIIYSLLGQVWLLFELFKSYYSQNKFIAFYPKISMSNLIFQFVLLGGTLFIICKPNIREVFRINNKKMISTIVVSIAFTLITAFF